MLKGWRKGAPKRNLETRIKQSKSLKGHNCNTKNKIVITNGKINKFINSYEIDLYKDKGWKIGSKPRNEEFKKVISLNSKGRIFINNGKISKMIKKSDLETYIKEGWIKGKIYERKINKE